MKVNVRIDSYDGKIIASGEMKKGALNFTLPVICDVTGLHAVYFEFISDSDNVIAEFYNFTFD